jgi:hypothetical protein
VASRYLRCLRYHNMCRKTAMIVEWCVICVFKRHDSWCKWERDFPRGISPFSLFFLPDTLKMPAGGVSLVNANKSWPVVPISVGCRRFPIYRMHPQCSYYFFVNTYFYYYSLHFTFFIFLSKFLISYDPNFTTINR